MLAFCLACRLTGRRNRRVDNLGVPRCRNFGLRGQNLVTDRTMLAFGLTGSLAGRGNCRVCHDGMPLCGNDFLLDQLLPADRAVLAFRLARRLAGRGDRRVYDLRVSRCRNLGLRDQHLMADRTMLAFRFAGHFAARCDRRVCHLCMPGCRNFCLRDQYLSANRAMLAFRLAGRLTGCGNRRVCHGGMPLRRNRCRLDQHLSANRAMLAFGLARFLAGCRNSRVSLHDVTYCGQIPLRLQRLIADRAVRSVTPARLGTGRRLTVVNDLRVSLRRQNLLERECPHTHGAVHALAHADGNAGRLHARQGNQGMIRQRHLFLCLHDCSARTAMGAFRQPLLHTGCRDGGIGHHGVSGCRNCFLFNNGHSADRAHAPLGTAVLGTGRRTGRQHLFDVSAEGRGNLSAYQANLILRTGGNVRIVCMSRCRDRLQTVQDDAASLPSAPRSAGVSRRLAGRLQFRNLHRNVIQLVQDSLRHDFNPANRAERTAGPAEVFAGRFLTGLKHFLVRQLRHRLRRSRAVAADLTLLPLGFASHRTGRCNGRMLDHPVSGSGHLLLRGQHCLANGAVRTDCLARLITGRLHGGVLHRFVPMRRDLGLRNANGKAGCAMLPFRQSVLGTGRRTGGIRHPCMPQRRHRLLRSQHAAADRAMLAFGLARLLAGCRYGGINCLLVSRGRHLRLLCQHLMADRAVLALCLAGFGAGRSHRLIRDLGMSRSRDFLRGNQNFVADLAVTASRFTSRFAGSRNRCIGDLHVTGRRNLRLLHEHLPADRAMLALGLTRLLAGCRYGGINCLLVSRGRHLRLLRQNLMADRAVLALCLAGFGTGRRHRLIRDLGVPRSRDFLRSSQNLVADRAMAPLRFACRLAGRPDGGIRHRNVSFGRDALLCGQHLAAIAAVTSLRFARLLTGRRHGGIGHGGVPLGKNIPLINQHLAANGAVTALRLSRFIAGRCHGGIDRLGMCRRKRLLLNQNLPADRAVLALCLAGFGTGRRHSLIRDLGMTKCRYRLLCPQNFPAGGAMRPRRQSVLLAGGGHGNVDLLGMPGRRDGSGLFLSAVGTAEDIVPVLGTGRRLPGAGYLLHIMIAQSFRFRAGRRGFRLGIRFRLFLRQSKFYLTAIPDGVARDKRRAYRQYQQKQQGAQCPAEAVMSAQRHSFSHAVYLPYQNSHRAPARRASPGTYMRLEQADFRRKKTACPGIPSSYFPHIISYPPRIFKGFPRENPFFLLTRTDFWYIITPCVIPTNPVGKEKPCRRRRR